MSLSLKIQARLYQPDMTYNRVNLFSFGGFYSPIGQMFVAQGDITGQLNSIHQTYYLIRRGLYALRADGNPTIATIVSWNYNSEGDITQIFVSGFDNGEPHSSTQVLSVLGRRSKTFLIPNPLEIFDATDYLLEEVMSSRKLEITKFIFESSKVEFTLDNQPPVQEFFGKYWQVGNPETIVFIVQLYKDGVEEIVGHIPFNAITRDFVTENFPLRFTATTISQVTAGMRTTK